MTLSVIYKIGTKQRLPWLRESLATLEKQTPAIESVVCLPTDRDFSVPKAADTVVEVSNPRLAVARNRGAEAASGEYVAFLDDDAYPSRHWAERIVASLERWDIVGGPIRPDWRESPLTWLPKQWHWLIGCGPYYDSSQLVPNTYGSNLAIRRVAFRDVGGFDESFGMGSGGIGQGLETDLTRRVRDFGYHGVWYDPEAIVYHIIQGRGSLRRLIGRAIEQGSAKAAIGVGSRESKFVRQELTGALRRPREAGVSAMLTAAVGWGYCRQKLRGRLQR